MAKLDSEDEQVKSCIDLSFLTVKNSNKKEGLWLPYRLIFRSGTQELVYEKTNFDFGEGDFLFSIEPVNEIEDLVNDLNNFLTSEESKTFLFEPLEPSFELILEKSFKGYSVSCWIDAGNVVSDHYTWDGLGIRFFTTHEKIQCFIEELKNDMKELQLCQNELI